jgi:hypothetical protein
MNRETKVSSVSIILCAIACLMSLNAVQAQQPGSSRFGAGTQHTVSTAGSGVPARSAGTSGSSTWEAGKGSFTSSAQPGGIWSDGSSFSASPGVAHSATQVLSPAASAPAFGAARSGNSSGSKVKPVGGNTASGMAHLSRSSPSQRFGTAASGHSPVSRASGINHPIGGSRGRTGSFGRGAGREKSPESHGLTSKVAQHPSTWRPTPSSSLKSGLDTGLINTGAGVQP